MRAALLIACLDRPRAVIGLAVLCLVVLSAGAARLSFDPRYGTFFEEDDPQLVAFEHLRDVFAPSDAIVFVVDPGEGSVLDADGLAALEQLTEGGWRLPFAVRVDSVTNFPHSTVTCETLDGEPVCDMVVVEPLVENAARLDAPDLARVREVVADAPELRGRLADPTGTIAAVAVTVIQQGDPMRATAELVDAARALAAETEIAHPGLRVHVGGIVAMNHAFSESSLVDSAVLLPAMFLLMFAGLAWLLGSIVRMAAVVAVVLGAILASLGVAGWMGMVLTTPVAVAPIIIATIAIADGVHIVQGQFSQTFDRTESEDLRALRLRSSLDENLRPVLLTTLTTAVGFLSMNFSAVPPFRDLGNVVALGVLVAGILSITLLPAILRLAPLDERPPRIGGRSFSRLAERMVTHRRSLLFGVCVALMALLPGLTRLEVNDDYVGYFDPALPFRTAAELTDAHLGGMYEIEYELTSLARGGVHAPAFLEEVDAFTAWLRAQPETGHVLAWTDVLKRLNRTLVGDGRDAYVLPADAETASQYTLLYELSLPLGQDLTNMIAPDHGSLRHLVSLKDMDSRAVIEFEARAGRWLAAHAPNISERHGGINLMFAHISERNVAAMFEGNALAVLVIAVILVFMLRSGVLALASLFTNLVPVFAAFGLWGWIEGDIGLALSTAFGMTLGIVVDDTVHLLSRFRRERAAGAEPAAAIGAALQRVGPALVVTTLILFAGFAVLATSTFAINGLLARITLITILLALLFDLLALPALLAWRDDPPPREAATDG